jgi:fumarate reductase iron-sulfur subunit
MSDRSAPPRHITIACQRFHPDTDTAPHWQRWDLPFSDDMSLLQGLQHIKDHLDGSLSFRWSCRMAICGSCGFLVNGVPQLGCQVFLRDLHPGLVRVAPLPNFPVLRDLVVDQGDFLDKLASVQPWLMPAQPRRLEDGPHRQTPAQMARYLATAQCINCGLCHAACPQVGLDEDFVGPAALALVQRWNADSRDQGFAARRDTLNATQGVWACTLVGHCSTVCPKGVDPAHAINQNKVNSALDYLGLGPLLTKGRDR